MRSTNGGAINYGNFQNIRICHAHTTGIMMEADETSIVK